jgi:DNA-binding NarL/FixJ family response regulator
MNTGRAGISVTSAKNFEELDARLAAVRPRLILMDVQMPELFGDDVASILRNVRGVKAKILLYSSLDASELAERAREAQIDGAISKSDGIAHMIQEVRRRLTDHGA